MEENNNENKLSIIDDTKIELVQQITVDNSPYYYNLPAVLFADWIADNLYQCNVVNEWYQNYEAVRDIEYTTVELFAKFNKENIIL